MKLGAYQFPITGDLARNLDGIRHGITKAAAQGIRLMVFPECSLTGYPPRHIASPASIDWPALTQAHDALQTLAVDHHMYLVVGTMLRENRDSFNSALLFTPNGQRCAYHKRALWGWDADNFKPGTQPGVWEIDGVRVGVRICYEVRFPEFFRELYKARTDLNILLFHDVADTDNADRYDLIRGHIRTRAVENVCPILTVNATLPYQTAPTGFYDASGQIIAELPRSQEGLLIADWSPHPLTFGEQGRKAMSDQLV